MRKRAPEPTRRKRRKQRRERVRALYLQGKTHGQIAAETHISESTVRSDLRYIESQRRQSLSTDALLAFAEELERLKLVENQAWDAWFRSQQDSLTEKVVVEQQAGKEKQRAEKVISSQVGDINYLKFILTLFVRRHQFLESMQGEEPDETIANRIHDMASLPNELLALLADAFRDYASGKAVDTRALCEHLQSRPLANGAAPGGIGSSADRPGVGKVGEADCPDAAPTWEI